MAEQTFDLPDLGEGIAEGKLVSWLVEVGETVEADQTIAEVETDKALVEIPSPFDSVVKELHAAEGETVPVDSVIVTFDVEGEPPDEKPLETESEREDELESTVEKVGENAEATDEAAGRVFASPSTRTLARELGINLADVSGSGPGGRVTVADVRSHAESSAGGAEPAQPEKAEADAPTEEKPVVVEGDGTARDRALAMPATRRLAREEGVDINNVPASEERDGEAFVTPEDVRAYVKSDGETAEAAGEGASGRSSGERVTYSGIRKTIGEQMARSKYTAPHVAHHDEFDAADLVAVREDLRRPAEAEGVSLTYLPFVVKAVTRALREFPYLNASLDEGAEEIVLHDEYNIGIAVSTDHGLMVPVVKHADEKGLVELAEEIHDLATRARNRELSRDKMRGGTFTITNIGAIGGEFSSPIINHPEAAILAMGPVRKRPWVIDDEVVARETMRLSMSVDHRLVDGAEAAQFTNRVQELLGQPARLLL